MKITVADTTKEVKDGITILELIEAENIENAQYVTVAVNDEFVDREKFGEFAIPPEAVVEFLYFMGGGCF
ncbi:MAG: sulfur carrier protein ThiS [Lachnospiraceae bacterium]